MNTESRDRWNYVTGTVLSIVLTLAAFGAVLSGAGRGLALAIVAAAAVAQIAVQLRFFLHLGFSGQKREDLQLVLFSLLLLTIMAGGTIWILTNLSGRMM
jgi:cytochrome o ubiquinol oxidase operon protein cyoD